MYCIARDVTQRKEAERKVYEYQQRLKDLANEITLTEERVRKQIAVDLHDQVGQILSSIRMQLPRVNTMLENPEATIRIKDISQALLKAIKATREAIFNLSLPQFKEFGLFAAVHDWTKEQIEGKHGIKTTISGEDEEFLLEENRILAKMPEFNIGYLDPFPLNFERYFSDHFPFRSELVKTFNKINFVGLKVSPLPDKVLIGLRDYGFCKNWDTHIKQKGYCRKCILNCLHSIKINGKLQEREYSQLEILLMQESRFH